MTQFGIIRVNVTATDIAQGFPCEGSACAVALAVEREVRAEVVITTRSAVVDGRSYPLPYEVRRFVEEFDAGVEVYPIAFSMPMDAAVIRPTEAGQAGQAGPTGQAGPQAGPTEAGQAPTGPTEAPTGPQAGPQAGPTEAGQAGQAPTEGRPNTGPHIPRPIPETVEEVMALDGVAMLFAFVRGRHLPETPHECECCLPHSHMVCIAEDGTPFFSREEWDNDRRSSFEDMWLWIFIPERDVYDDYRTFATDLLEYTR